jgi:hypothetical protein
MSKIDNIAPKSEKDKPSFRDKVTSKGPVLQEKKSATKTSGISRILHTEDEPIPEFKGNSFQKAAQKRGV